MERSKKKHGNIDLNITRVGQNIDSLRSQSDWSAHEEAKLELELENLFSLEEKYWKTQSRADWLMEEIETLPISIVRHRRDLSGTLLIKLLILIETWSLT